MLTHVERSQRWSDKGVGRGTAVSPKYGVIGPETFLKFNVKSAFLSRPALLRWLLAMVLRVLLTRRVDKIVAGALEDTVG